MIQIKIRSNTIMDMEHFKHDHYRADDFTRENNCMYEYDDYCYSSMRTIVLPPHIISEDSLTIVRDKGSMKRMKGFFCKEGSEQTIGTMTSSASRALNSCDNNVKTLYVYKRGRKKCICRVRLYSSYPSDSAEMELVYINEPFALRNVRSGLATIISTLWISNPWLNRVLCRVEPESVCVNDVLMQCSFHITDCFGHHRTDKLDICCCCCRAQKSNEEPCVDRI